MIDDYYQSTDQLSVVVYT